jgi:lysophospholipase L1-like esterase
MHCLDDTIEEIVWRVNKPDSGLYMTYGKMHVTRVGFTYGTKRVELWTSDGTYDFGLKQMDVRPGDLLKMVIIRGFCSFEVIVYNQTTLAKVNYTYDYDMSKTSGAIMPDTYYRQLYFGPMGTDDIDIVSVKMGIRDINPDILCIGDSITAGYNGGMDRYAAILEESNLTTVAGGPSDGTTNCELSCSTLLPVMKPANIILAIGVNDGAGINREKYTNIVNMCVATGANVRLMLMANDVRDQTADYNWICQQWPTLVMTDVWTTTLKPGSTTGQVKPEYKSDANHFNRLGHLAIAAAIKKYI